MLSGNPESQGFSAEGEEEGDLVEAGVEVGMMEEQRGLEGIWDQK